ncbi:MAG TPA: glycosyltransferase family 39 protein, partial [Candidatus Kapabacteria bacterium]|nr:glycosyltransferase family 39 protein [Candidatus Kapabacteria bacterium]
YAIAQNILAGKGYSYQFEGGTLQQTCYIPPGYVGVLVALWKCGISDTGVQIINAIIYILSAVVVYSIARRLGQSRDVSFLAFLAIAFYPPLWLLIFVPSPNAINIFLILVTVDWLLVTQRAPSLKNFLILGVLFAVQIYIRPDCLVWAPLCILWLWYFTRNKLSRAVFTKYTIAAATLAVISVTPWTIRNYMVFHKFIFISANGGSNLWVGNNPNATGEFPEPEERNGIIGQDKELVALDHAEQDSLLEAKALQYIYTHPVRTVEMFFVKAYYHWWVRPHLGDNRAGAAMYEKLYIALYALVLLCTIWGLIILYKRGNRMGVSLILMVFLYSTLIAGIFFTQTRHRMIKVEPLMLLCGAVAVGSLVERKRFPETQYSDMEKADIA